MERITLACLAALQLGVSSAPADPETPLACKSGFWAGTIWQDERGGRIVEDYSIFSLPATLDPDSGFDFLAVDPAVFPRAAELEVVISAFQDGRLLRQSRAGLAPFDHDRKYRVAKLGELSGFISELYETADTGERTTSMTVELVRGDTVLCRQRMRVRAGD